MWKKAEMSIFGAILAFALILLLTPGIEFLQVNEQAFLMEENIQNSLKDVCACNTILSYNGLKFENGVAGFGFLALAVMIFGQWKPTRIAVAALIFGLFRALSNVYFGFDFLVSLNIPGSVYNMMPYIICLIVLAFTSQKSRAPKAEGIPYDKGER